MKKQNKRKLKYSIFFTTSILCIIFFLYSIQADNSINLIIRGLFIMILIFAYMIKDSNKSQNDENF
jgi:L-asparagine transporter-like permease